MTAPIKQERDLVVSFHDYFWQGNAFTSITEARKFAKSVLGRDLELSDHREIEEAIEQSLILYADGLIKKGANPLETYRGLVDLYKRQPRLGSRTSESILLQQYSTPIPLGYLGAVVAGVSQEDLCYEPTAGHGSLTLGCDRNRTQVNEISPSRFQFLERRGFQKATNEDALSYSPESTFSYISINPPFSKNQERENFVVQIGKDSFYTPYREQAIVLKALSRLRDNGKAFLILPGFRESYWHSREDQYDTGKTPPFYTFLYEHFQVVNHISLTSELYERQGTGFPVDLIWIKGRGHSKLPMPYERTPVCFNSFEALEELIQNRPLPPVIEPLKNRISGFKPWSGTMRFYFSGVASKREREWLETAGATDLLLDAVDYAKQKNDIRDRNVIRDSGAYRKFRETDGKGQISLSEWSVDLSDRQFDAVVAPDVIRDPDATLSYWVQVRERYSHLPLMPVWQWGAPKEHLDIYLADAEVVGIGGLIGPMRDQDEEMLAELVELCETYPGRFHIFAARWPKAISALKNLAYSADSSLWLAGARYKELVHISPITKKLTRTAATRIRRTGNDAETLCVESARNIMTYLGMNFSRPDQPEPEEPPESLADETSAEPPQSDAAIAKAIRKRNLIKTPSQGDYQTPGTRLYWSTLEEWALCVSKLTEMRRSSPRVDEKAKAHLDLLLATDLIEQCQDKESLTKLYWEMGRRSHAQLPTPLRWPGRGSREGHPVVDLHNRLHNQLQRLARHPKAPNPPQITQAEWETAVRFGWGKLIDQIPHTLNPTTSQWTPVEIVPDDLSCLAGNQVEEGAEALRKEGEADDISLISPESRKSELPYQPKSKSPTNFKSLVPINLATATQDALDRLEKAVKNVDQYVFDMVGLWSSLEAMWACLSAEQVDAIALAIYQAERNKAAVIGDAPGGGKGRIGAALLHYAKKKGLTPIFVTRDAKLYADMVRDATNIGWLDFKPLATNKDLVLPLPNGRILKTTGTLHAQNLEKAFQQGSIDGMDYDAVFTTVFQIQTVGGEETFRRALLTRLATRGFALFDESHTATGSKEPENGWKKKGPPNRSAFAKDFIERCWSAAFMSATSARDAHALTLYSLKSDMDTALDNPNKVQELLEEHGVPLAQAVATQSASAGQYIRRQRSMEGIEFEIKVLPASRDQADLIADAMRLICDFDKLKKPAVEEKEKELKYKGGNVATDKAAGLWGLESTDFYAIAHNFLNQESMALKAEATVEEAKKALAQGYKPVISIYHTMGSFLSKYSQQENLNPGDPVVMGFGDLLRRYLERTRIVIVNEGDKPPKHHRLTDEELGKEAVAAYREARDFINEMADELKDLPISPLDYITYHLEKAGYKVGEITGRKDILEYLPTGRTCYQVRSAKETSKAYAVEMADAFNNGDLDVLILGAPGSTGISLHSSVDFKDQRPRLMLMLGHNPRVEEWRQSLGRLDRVGQICLPKYILLVAEISSEKRITAILASKLASLNANVIAARDSGINLSLPDFLNEYGDEVFRRLLEEDTELDALLGKPRKGGKPGELSRVVTGRIAMQKTAVQDEIYERFLRDYAEYLEEQRSLGNNALEAETFDMRAETIKTQVLLPAKDYNNPFGAAAYLETVLGRPIQQPPTRLEVINAVSKALELPKVLNSKNYDVAKLPELGKEASQRLGKEAREDAIAYLERQKSLIAQPSENSKDKKEVEKYKTAIDKVETTISENYTFVTEVLERFPVGMPLHYSKSKKGSEPPVLGVVTRIWRTSGSPNPVAPSNWKLQILLTRSNRPITIPFNQLRRSEGSVYPPVILNPLGSNKAQIEAAYSQFNESAVNIRERMHLITGNILRAAEKFYSAGPLINFTNVDGEIRPGILVKVEIEDLKAMVEKSPVPMTSVEFCVSFLNQGYSLQTLDEHLRIVKDVDGGKSYFLECSATQAARKYSIDKDLLDAANAQFYSTGVRMLMEVKPSRIAKVIKALGGDRSQLASFEHK
ncbi:MAG TPA: strawberry notch C-terminal domain-containing protein, partial [Leptolyngbyaceae cyanobacterium]